MKLCTDRICVTIDEFDGAGWVEDGKIVLNMRWAYPWEVEEYIVKTTIHELVEHEIGAGHEVAVKAEKMIEV